MVRIVVLGATGPTGVLVLRKALEVGDMVTAAVRSSGKVTMEHENLQVKEANIFSEESLTAVFEGHDGVISCLGVHSAPWSSVSLYSESIKHITASMRKANISRFIEKPGNPRLVEWVLKPFVMGRLLADMYRMEEYLIQHCSDLNYTIVKPPGLSNGQKDDRTLVKAPGEEVAAGNASMMVPRANIADFLVELLTTDEYNKQLVAVGLA